MNEEKQGANNSQNINDIQRDLENQLKAFGTVATDAFRYGVSEGAANVGSAALGVAAAFAESVQKEIQIMHEKQRNQQSYHYTPKSGGAHPYEYSSMNRAKHPYTSQAKTNSGGAAYRYSANINKSTKSNPVYKKGSNLFGTGLALAITGGFFGFPTMLAGIITALTDAPSIAIIIPMIIGSAFMVPFGIGMDRIDYGKRLKAYGTLIGTSEAISYRTLADGLGRSESYVKKELKKFVRNGWIFAWLDDKKGVVYFSQEAYEMGSFGYYAPQNDRNKETFNNVKQEEQKVEEPKKQEQASEQNEHDFVKSVRNFTAVLGKQKNVMEEQEAIANLEEMQEISNDIYNWLKNHPENISKIRRFVSYYIPTTLKLFHHYNEVKGQQGENAENIRRDITGMLGTLNSAFKNLHDTLLSEVALDISAEISAMQGMLAQDGLSPDGGLETNLL